VISVSRGIGIVRMIDEGDAHRRDESKIGASRHELRTELWGMRYEFAQSR
jgi:hypothetical protein